MADQHLCADGREHQDDSQFGGGRRGVRVGASSVRSLAIRLELSCPSSALKPQGFNPIALHCIAGNETDADRAGFVVHPVSSSMRHSL